MIRNPHHNQSCHSMISSIEKKTLREQVLDSLKSAILSGELTPGTHLSEVALSESFKVSRGTIREALRSLQQARLVEDAPRGLRVRVMPSQEIKDLYDARAALESLAVTTIMAKDNAAEIIDSLAQALPPTETDSINFTELFELDLSFHRKLVAHSDNQVLIRLWDQLQEQMRTAILRDKPETVRTIMTRAAHAPILDCMTSQDSSQASEHLYSHMRQAARILTEDG